CRQVRDDRDEGGGAQAGKQEAQRALVALGTEEQVDDEGERRQQDQVARTDVAEEPAPGRATTIRHGRARTGGAGRGVAPRPARPCVASATPTRPWMALRSLDAYSASPANHFSTSAASVPFSRICCRP